MASSVNKIYNNLVKNRLFYVSQMIALWMATFCILFFWCIHIFKYCHFLTNSGSRNWFVQFMWNQGHTVTTAWYHKNSNILPRISIFVLLRRALAKQTSCLCPTLRKKKKTNWKQELRQLKELVIGYFPNILRFLKSIRAN